MRALIATLDSDPEVTCLIDLMETLLSRAGPLGPVIDTVLTQEVAAAEFAPGAVYGRSSGGLALGLRLRWSLVTSRRVELADRVVRAEGVAYSSTVEATRAFLLPANATGATISGR